MKILIMHQSLSAHDAVGNDIERMYRALAEKEASNKKEALQEATSENTAAENTAVYVYAENIGTDKLPTVDKETALEIIADSTSLIIYHHSFYWPEGQKLLENIKGKLIFKYHNITPPEFFKGVDDATADILRKGRAQTVELQKSFHDAYWLCDSIYNSTDIKLAPAEKMGICPPFNMIDAWGDGAEDETLTSEIKADHRIGLFFAGRMVPNKGYTFLLKALKAYVNDYGKDIVLRLIGKPTGYMDTLNQEIKKLGLEENVIFSGEISDAKLISYYKNSDIFVCASEHEGFCVPLIEAQYFGLPIIAIRSSAVGETLGAEQVLLDRDSLEMAAAIHVLAEDENKRKFLAKKGRENYDSRFTPDEIKRKLIEFVDYVAGDEPASTSIFTKPLPDDLYDRAAIWAEIEEKGIKLEIPGFEDI